MSAIPSRNLFTKNGALVFGGKGISGKVACFKNYSNWENESCSKSQNKIYQVVLMKIFYDWQLFGFLKGHKFKLSVRGKFGNKNEIDLLLCSYYFLYNYLQLGNLMLPKHTSLVLLERNSQTVKLQIQFPTTSQN